MHFSTILISALSAVACASAARLEAFLVNRVHPVSDLSIRGEGVGRRQTASGTVPAACTSICDPVNTEVNDGCPVTACCSDSFETAYYDCLQCVGSALNATDYTTAQDYLNTLWITCEDMGYDLPELSLPGQQPSGSSSSSTTPAAAPVPGTTAAGTGGAEPTVFPSASAGTATTSSAPATTTTPTSAGVRIRVGNAWGVLVGAGVLGLVGVW
ncbi:hypothetical protein HYDPIDRAFT_23703 [Hydnomerulius pinastri MD-312]|nr:hypothetical protein HYDPIDRAFT_23703 [Hydnomerulius pinastri MD-312]